MNTYHPTSNAQAQMTHALWDAADAMDYDAMELRPTNGKNKNEKENAK